MSRRRRLALLAVVAAQVAVPVGMAGLAAADLAFGREIRLRVQPVDPFDVFRGNYVALRYEISSLQTAIPIARGQTVCTTLHERDGAWTGSEATTERPDADVVVCGRARSDADPGGTVAVEYGIETYIASADRARELEGELARGRVFAVVDLDEDGRPRLERLEAG